MTTKPTTKPTIKPTIPQPTPPTGPYNPIFGLQEKVASLLIPIFRSDDSDDLFAYQVACRSLEAYEPETRPDFVNAGRTIAFSLAAMALLGEAADPAMQLKEKMRILVHATALNRSADQAERSMMERRRYQRAYPTLPALQPAAPPPEPEIPEPEIPEPEIPESEIPELELPEVAEAVATYSAAQTHRPNRPSTTPNQGREHAGCLHPA